MHHVVRSLPQARSSHQDCRKVNPYLDAAGRSTRDFVWPARFPVASSPAVI
jgi:hypothetical protein